MKIFKSSSTVQKLLKIQEEIVDESEAEKPLLLDRDTETQPKVISFQTEIAELMKKDLRMGYQLVESLVIDRLTKELRIQPQRNLSLRNRSSMVMFDAIFQRPDGITVIEVKFFSGQICFNRIEQTIQRIQASLLALPQNVQQNASLILAVAYDMSEESAEKVKRELESFTLDSFIPIEVRMFSLPDLLKDLEI